MLRSEHLDQSSLDHVHLHCTWHARPTAVQRWRHAHARGYVRCEQHGAMRSPCTVCTLCTAWHFEAMVPCAVVTAPMHCCTTWHPVHPVAQHCMAPCALHHAGTASSHIAASSQHHHCIMLLHCMAPCIVGHCMAPLPVQCMPPCILHTMARCHHGDNAPFVAPTVHSYHNHPTGCGRSGAVPP